MSNSNVWIYQGPVEMFGKCVCNDYYAATNANSYSEAERNIKHQFRIEANLAKNKPLSLKGTIYRVPKKKKNHIEGVDEEAESIQLSIFD